MFNKSSAWVLGLIVAFSTMGFASVTSTNQTVALSATVPTSLTVSLSSNAVNFNNITPGNSGNPGATGITVTTAWTLQPSHTSLALYAYFATTNAMTDGTFNIPTSAFEISMNAGALTPVNGTNAGFGVAGSSLLLKTTAINGANKSGTSNDALTFNLNLGAITNLEAGTYTGTLNIQAQATP